MWPSRYLQKHVVRPGFVRRLAPRRSRPSRPLRSWPSVHRINPKRWQRLFAAWKPDICPTDPNGLARTGCEDGDLLQVVCCLGLWPISPYVEPTWSTVEARFNQISRFFHSSLWGPLIICHWNILLVKQSCVFRKPSRKKIFEANRLNTRAEATSRHSRWRSHW